MQSLQQSCLDDRLLPEQKLIQKKRYRSGHHLFYSFFWKSPLLILFSLVMNIFSAIFTLAPAVLTGIAIDILSEEGFGDKFILTCGLIIITGLLYLFTSFAANYSFGITAFRYERDVRQEFFDVIQSHSMTFHHENNSSRLLSMGMTEISQIRHGLHPSMRILTQSFFGMLGTLLLLTQINIFYGVIILIGIPLYFYLAYRYSSKIGPIRNELANEIGSLTESCQEIFRGIEVVRGLSAEEKEQGEFRRKSLNYARLSEKEGINVFLDGYIPSENMRFRNYS
ncbi:MAG: ABC transporter transmembrane domain-containing protein, partial [Promethearchaeota archaeon]